MIGFLRWIWLRYRNRHDAGLASLKFGSRLVYRGYDEQKAVTGARRARRQSATGRKYPKVKRTVKRGAEIVPIRKVSDR